MRAAMPIMKEYWSVLLKHCSGHIKRQQSNARISNQAKPLCIGLNKTSAFKIIARYTEPTVSLAITIYLLSVYIFFRQKI